MADMAKKHDDTRGARGNVGRRARDLAARFARMALVFALVFATSLGAELMLLRAHDSNAAPALDGALISTLSIHEQETAPTDENDAQQAPGKQIRSVEDVLSDNKQTYIPQIDSFEGTERFAAFAVLQREDGTNEQVNATQLLDWSVDDQELATLDPAEDSVVLQAKESGAVTVTATLKDAYASMLVPELTERLGGAKPQLSFSVEILSQEAPYIANVTVLDANGEELDEERVLQLDSADAEQPYGLQAHVTVFDPASSSAHVHTCTPEQGLAELTDGEFADLSWIVESEGNDESEGDGSGASIDEHGVLTLNGATSARVTCTAPSGAPDAETPHDSIIVRVSDGDDGDDGEGGGGGGDTPTEPTEPTAPEEPSEPQPGDTPGDDGGEGSNTQPDTPETPTEPNPPATGEDTGVLAVYLSYMPVPLGETACLSSYISGVHGVTYITTWFESTDGGTTWTQLGNVGSNTLKKPCKEPYLGRQYRTRVDLVSGADKLADPTKSSAYSPVVTLEATDEPLGVMLLVDYVPVGQDALFTTVTWGDGINASTLDYAWEESGDAGATWSPLTSGYQPILSIYTETERLGHQFRVRITTPDGLTALSNTQMLAATTADATDDPTPVGGSSAQDPTGQQPPKTLSETVDEQGSAHIALDDGKTATIKPVGNIRTNDANKETEAVDKQKADKEPSKKKSDKKSDKEKVDKADAKAGEKDAAPAKGQAEQQGQHAVEKTDITLDPKVSQNIAAQKDAQRKELMETQPGARWNPIYVRDEQPQLNEILEDSPIALLLVPLALASVAAGAFEKAFRFRRQTAC